MVDSNLYNTQAEDLFMEAVTRLEAGEALEAVLADFPAEERDELRELLTIVAATHHLQESAIPHPSPERRATGKRAFLQAAADRKPSVANEVTAQQRGSTATEEAMIHAAAVAVTDETDARQTTAEQSVSTHVTNRQAATARAIARPPVGPTWDERLRAMWAALLNSFTPVSVRLAPLALMLLILWLTSFGVVSAAQDSLPGDIVYPAKKWIREQALTLAAPEDKPQVNEKNEEEVAEETEMVRARGTAVLVENVFIFHGYKDDYLHIGPFYVEAENLTMPADVMPGAGVQVRLRYQVAPEGEGRTDDGVPIVQGIALSVVEDAEPIPPTATPTAVPTMTVSATNTPTNTPTCSPWRPDGWAAYTVQPGDNLGEIANRVGSSTAELIAVNCISDANVIRSGARLWVPRAPVVITPAPVTTTNTPLVLTLTTVSTAQPTAVSLTPTASTPFTSTPTLLTPTVEATTVEVTPEVTPTVPVSGTVVATATPRPETTPIITVTATVAVTGTSVAPESTPVVTGTSAVGTPTPVLPTPATGVTTTVEATPDSEPESTATAPTEAAATAEGTLTETPAATETAVTGTVTPDATTTPRPTTDASRAGTAVPETATAVPTTATPDGGAAEPDNGNPDDSGDGGSGDEDGDEVGGASGGEDEPTDGTTGDSVTATDVPVATPVNPTATTPPQATAVPPSPTATAVVYPTATAAGNTSTGGGGGGTEPPTVTPTPISRSPLGSG